MMTRRPSTLSRTLALIPPTVVLVAQHSSGAMSGFLKIGDIKGESNAADYKDWIDVQSVQWNASRAVFMPSGGMRERGDPVISELTISKRVDQSSPAIFLNLVGGGGPVSTVTLELTTSTGEGPVVFYRLTLNDVYVTAQSHSAATGGGEISESISLNFAKIKIEYFMMDPKGGFTAIEPVEYDLTQASK
jgi:type VI secretion system secreted protein Hcp